jgi:NodT family efflux transporter outer membrane factor (OMF) lipoprotein
MKTPALFVLAAATTLAACGTHHMTYVPPPVEPVGAYKENANWKTVAPQDAEVRGNWWEMFSDPQLDALEVQVSVSNDTLKAVEAQFNQARALVRGSRAALFPQVTTTPSATRSQLSSNRVFPSPPNSFNDILLPVSASYEADVWGRIHNEIDATRIGAQASAADLESARLSVHADLALDYFTLRGLDREQQLLEDAVDAYGRALDLTQNRFRGGIASQADVALAETQLETTRAQAVDISTERAILEHAIAVLIGRPASSFAMATAPLSAEPPGIPAGVPTELLERRPDIAAAERRVASANAQVGVATAAYYPLLTLTGSVGFESSSFGNLLTSASNFWALGPAAVATLFDAGRRHAQADQARAQYAETAALYQASVLTAFREVEDQLSTLRILEEEAGIQARAVDAAERSLTQATNRYRGGVSTYLEVIASQSALLNNQRAAVGILIRRMVASVLLLKALGGGWRLDSLPKLTANDK